MEEIVYTGEKFYYACQVLQDISNKFQIGYSKTFGAKKLVIECAKEDVLDIKNMVNLRSFKHKT